MDPDAAIDAVEFGESLDLGGVRVSLHPAGHILGSAQVRIEIKGRVLVVSGDYKVEPDRTCSAFEPVRCHIFLTESTFGLPIYRWQPETAVYDEINAWWRSNCEAGRASLIFGYSLGKAQRILAGVDPTIGPIYVHGAVSRLVRAYRESGVDLPPTSYANTIIRGEGWAGAMIVAPPSAHGSPWARKFGPASTGLASGWMRIRGTRRRKSVDRGFVLSDHADWPGLLSAIEATGAESVWITHGYSSVLARYLQDRGTEARIVPTRYEGEADAADAEDDVPDADEPSPTGP
jgi:putative mRNA 3-end processing factor